MFSFSSLGNVFHIHSIHTVYKLSKIDEIQCTILYGATKKRTKMGMTISSGIITIPFAECFCYFQLRSIIFTDIDIILSASANHI
jgi:hypothetical protein